MLLRYFYSLHYRTRNFLIFFLAFAVRSVLAETPQIATLSYPQNMAVQVDPTVQFTWGPVAGAQVYYLYVGTAPGLKDVYDSGETTSTALTVRVAFRTTYYARLYTEIDNLWYHSSDISFTTTSLSPAQIITPTSTSTLYGTSPVAFSWTSIPSASAYYLYVGTAPGTKDVIDSSEITVTTLSRLLSPGTYYARVYTEIAQSWYVSSDICFTVLNASTLSFPADGATDIDPYINFSWPASPGADAYSLAVGTSPGASNALAAAQIPGTSYQASAPLQPNTTYYAQLGTHVAGHWSYANSTFTTGTGIAHVLSPADGSTDVDVSTKLSWSSVADAQAYYVYVGSAPGLSDVFDSSEIQATSLAVPSFQPSIKYYIRLFTEKNSHWFALNYSFTTGVGIAQMLYPADGAASVDPALPFQWSSDPNATKYQVYIGTSPGANDVLDSGQTLDTSVRVRVSAPGTYYIRLFTVRSDRTRFIDSSFTLGDFIAHLINPSNHAFFDPFAEFTWTFVPSADTYYLTVGTTQGSREIFDSGELTGTNMFVPNLVAGTTYFVRLYTHRGEFWYSTDTSFLAGNALATLTNPQDGALISPLAVFSWSVPDFPVDAYYLIIGSTLGARDVYESGSLQDTSVKPAGLDFGKSYYATLFTLKGGFWRPTQSTFTTLPQDAISDLAGQKAAFYALAEQTTAAVRRMADPITNIPVADTPLASFLKASNLERASCVEYATVLKLQLASVGVKARLRYITLTGTTPEAHTLLEYYDPFLQKWSIADPTFGILFFDPATQTGQSVEEINALVLAQDSTDIHITAVTSYGNTLLAGYYMDPLTLYTNFTPPDLEQEIFGPQPNSPFEFLQEVPVEIAIGQPGIYLFSFGDASEQAKIILQAGAVMTISPLNGTLFSGASGLDAGWQFDSAPGDLKAYTFRHLIF